MFARGFLLLATTSAVLGARVLSGAKVNTEAYEYVSAANRAHHTQELEFTVYLPSSDDAGLERKMNEIALNRDLPWLTDDQLGGYVRPQQRHIAAVKQHLAAHGLSDNALTWSQHQDQVRVKATAKAVQDLFPGTDLHVYKYKGVKHTLKSHAIHIPDQLDEAVAHISHLADFPVTRGSAVHAPKHIVAEQKGKRSVPSVRMPHARRSKHSKRLNHVQGGPIEAPIAHAHAHPAAAGNPPTNLTGHLYDCDQQLITAACLRHYYGTYDYTQELKDDKATAPDTTIFGYIGENADQADLTTYLKQFRPEAAGYKIDIVDIDHAVTNTSNPSTEPQLDIQLVVGQSWPLQSKYVNLGSPDDPLDIFLQTFDWLLYHPQGKLSRPGVVSISYTADEAGMTESGAYQMCNSAKKLSALGTTIAVSSGDYGVEGFGAGSGEYCDSLDGKGDHPFLPLYPVDCPYILAVGANRGFNGIADGEAMVNITQIRGEQHGFYSGAGRSNIFPIPEYQKGLVEHLYKRIEHSPTEPSFMYNHSGRVYPDVTANGWWAEIVVGGQFAGVGGTSASTPTTAATLALVNDALVRAGKSRLGWAHPLFYSKQARSQVFKDIYQGGSFGCTPLTNPNDYGQTFVGAKARTGYDSSSGLGSLRFKPLVKLLGI